MGNWTPGPVKSAFRVCCWDYMGRRQLDARASRSTPGWSDPHREGRFDRGETAKILRNVTDSTSPVDAKAHIQFNLSVHFLFYPDSHASTFYYMYTSKSPQLPVPRQLTFKCHAQHACCRPLSHMLIEIKQNCKRLSSPLTRYISP